MGLVRLLQQTAVISLNDTNLLIFVNEKVLFHLRQNRVWINIVYKSLGFKALTGQDLPITNTLLIRLQFARKIPSLNNTISCFHIHT
jgi:hypothetical protein